MLILLAVGIIGVAVCFVMELSGEIVYVPFGIAAFGALMSLVSIPINAASRKKVKKLEHDIEHLKD